MERLLRITNALLGIIALCLVLLVASVYRVDSVATAHAQMGRNPAQPVYLVYQDRLHDEYPVVGIDGKVPTKLK